MLIDLELYEVNLVLKVLGERPYNEVAFIIQNIKNQVEQQNENN